MKTKIVPPKHLHFAVLAVDVVCFRVIGGRLNVLLGKVTTAPAFLGKWSVIGGLIMPDETADEAVERHLRDKAGIANIFHEQLYTFSALDRDPRGRVVSVAYIALTDTDQKDTKTKIETKWCPVENLPHLAYDHDGIVGMAIGRLRSKFEYSNIAQFLLPQEFTMSELQKLYEVVMGKGMDKRNFRKKVLQNEILKDTKRTRKEGVMRPAALYRFASKKPEIVNMI